MVTLSRLQRNIDKIARHDSRIQRRLERIEELDREAQQTDNERLRRRRERRVQERIEQLQEELDRFEKIQRREARKLDTVKEEGVKATPEQREAVSEAQKESAKRISTLKQALRPVSVPQKAQPLPPPNTTPQPDVFITAEGEEITVTDRRLSEQLRGTIAQEERLRDIGGSVLSADLQRQQQESLRIKNQTQVDQQTIINTNRPRPADLLTLSGLNKLNKQIQPEKPDLRLGGRDSGSLISLAARGSEKISLRARVLDEKGKLAAAEGRTGDARKLGVASKIVGATSALVENSPGLVITGGAIGAAGKLAVTSGALQAKTVSAIGKGAIVGFTGPRAATSGFKIATAKDPFTRAKETTGAFLVVGEAAVLGKLASSKRLTETTTSTKSQLKDLLRERSPAIRQTTQPDAGPITGKRSEIEKIVSLSRLQRKKIAEVSEGSKTSRLFAERTTSDVSVFLKGGKQTLLRVQGDGFVKEVGSKVKRIKGAGVQEATILDPNKKVAIIGRSEIQVTGQSVKSKRSSEFAVSRDIIDRDFSSPLTPSRRQEVEFAFSSSKKPTTKSIFLSQQKEFSFIRPTNDVLPGFGKTPLLGTTKTRTPREFFTAGISTTRRSIRKGEFISTSEQKEVLSTAEDAIVGFRQASLRLKESSFPKKRPDLRFKRKVARNKLTQKRFGSLSSDSVVDLGNRILLKKSKLKFKNSATPSVFPRTVSSTVLDRITGAVVSQTKTAARTGASSSSVVGLKTQSATLQKPGTTTFSTLNPSKLSLNSRSFLESTSSQSLRGPTGISLLGKNTGDAIALTSSSVLGLTTATRTRIKNLTSSITGLRTGQQSFSLARSIQKPITTPSRGTTLSLVGFGTRPRSRPPTTTTKSSFRPEFRLPDSSRSKTKSSKRTVSKKGRFAPSVLGLQLGRSIGKAPKVTSGLGIRLRVRG